MLYWKEGARTALLVTAGFRDLLTMEISNDLIFFTLNIRKTVPSL